MEDEISFNLTRWTPCFMKGYVSRSCTYLISENVDCVSIIHCISCQTPQPMLEIWV